jgi:hypothetical protein
MRSGGRGAVGVAVDDQRRDVDGSELGAGMRAQFTVVEGHQDDTAPKRIEASRP